jgi:AbiV family abortive infection protein
MAKRLPDPHEAIEGATVAAATAARLLSGADVLAGVASYGIARSLAVLALEESVKARTLGAIAAHGGHTAFSDDFLRKIVYSGHKERHEAGLVQHLAATSPDVFGRLLLGISIGEEEQAKIEELRKILADANSGKQAGFYSDFDPESGSWSAPDCVTDAEFAKIRALSGDYVNQTQQQLDEFVRFQRSAGAVPSGS